jgi:YbbR domain-containing protein
MEIRKSIANKLAHNTGMKVLAFFCALFLWFYVAILQDPMQTSNIRNIPIVLANTSVIKDKGLVIVSTPEDSLNLKVKANRSAIAKLHRGNITATIDLAGYASVGTHDIKIDVDFPIGGVTIEDQSLAVGRVSIDAYSKRSIDFEVRQGGELRGGRLDEITIETKKITIEGPKKDLDLIDKAIIFVDLAKDSEFEKEIKLYSSNGTEIINDLFVLSVAQIKGKVKIIYE